MHSLAHGLRLSVLLLLLGALAYAEPPRTELKTPPRISGRVVKELMLATSVYMGSGGPAVAGGPTIPGNYAIRANRFIPVSEDPDYVYYQANESFTEGSSVPGGLRMSKTYPDEVYAYFGDGRYPKIKLNCWQPLLPGDVRKIRVRYADAGAKAR